MRAPVLGPLAGHEIQIRDLRRLYGDPEHHGAECSCGWFAAARVGPNSERLAKRDAAEHIDNERVPRR
jgi:hypothetical protein